MKKIAATPSPLQMYKRNKIIMRRKEHTAIWVLFGCTAIWILFGFYLDVLLFECYSDGVSFRRMAVMPLDMRE